MSCPSFSPFALPNRFAAAAQPHFGKRPPKLFQPLKPEELEQFREGEEWRDPDDEWVRDAKGKVNLRPEEIDRIIHQTERGALYLLPITSLSTLREHLGLNGLRKVIREMGGVRVFKELVKYWLKDPFQQYWPIRVNGYWAHLHDATHLEVSRLAPIRMGKVNGVNGIDGHSYRVVPLFHPDNPKYKAKYNGLLDEYRVGIHVYFKNPNPMNTLRLLYYVVRMLPEVPDPWNAIKAHKETMRQAGLLPAQSKPAANENEEPTDPSSDAGLQTSG